MKNNKFIAVYDVRRYGHMINVGISELDFFNEMVLDDYQSSLEHVGEIFGVPVAINVECLFGEECREGNDNE